MVALEVTINGVGRAYAGKIEQASSKELGGFLRFTPEKDGSKPPNRLLQTISKGWLNDYTYKFINIKTKY